MTKEDKFKNIILSMKKNYYAVDILLPAEYNKLSFKTSEELCHYINDITNIKHTEKK